MPDGQTDWLRDQKQNREPYKQKRFLCCMKYYSQLCFAAVLLCSFGNLMGSQGFCHGDENTNVFHFSKLCCDLAHHNCKVLKRTDYFLSVNYFDVKITTHWYSFMILIKFICWIDFWWLLFSLVSVINNEGMNSEKRNRAINLSCKPK